MLKAYCAGDRKLTALKALPEGAALDTALWIDLHDPDPSEIAAVEALGMEVPTLAEMEEIEISARLYREEGLEYMTIVVPALSDSDQPIAGPVTFILGESRLVTVRHHKPRPFETYPARAGRAVAGTTSPERIYLGLIEEIVARLADLLEGAGRGLDEVNALVFGEGADAPPDAMKQALRKIGRQGELLGRVRLGLLSLERALSFYAQSREAAQRDGAKMEKSLKNIVQGQTADVQALSVHVDFLSARVSLAVDATLGMINLQENDATRALSVVGAVFLPPTLIASVFGMNFGDMPWIQTHWGFTAGMILMLGSAVGSYLLFKFKKWL